jgi:transmembrane sensor
MTNPHPPHDSHDPAPDWEAIARFQAGESPVDEARAVEAWLASHPGDAELLQRLDASIAEAGFRPASGDDAGDIDVEAALRRVKMRRDNTPPRGVVRQPSRPSVVPIAPPARRRVGWPLATRLVAAVAMIGGLVSTLNHYRNAHSLPDERPSGMLMSRTRGIEPGAVVATATGVRDSVGLPDGTRVILAPGSRLTVASDYGRTSRGLTIEGAALFDVAHDATRPFTVRAGNAIVRDVGTKFTVRTDGVDSAGGVAVQVAEGIVALRSASAPAGDSGIVLRARDGAELLGNGRLETERGGVRDDDLAWTRGRLAYDGASLVRVGADLKRWYGVDLQIADPELATRRVTGSFTGDPVSRVIDVIALAVGADAARTGSAVVVLHRAGGRVR